MVWCGMVWYGSVVWWTRCGDEWCGGRSGKWCGVVVMVTVVVVLVLWYSDSVVVMLVEVRVVVVA